jgi:hypothetical protein
MLDCRKSMGPRGARSRGPGRAGHPAARVGSNPCAGLNQRSAPPRHGGAWRDPAWGGFVLRRHFGEPPHKTRRPSPPSTPLGRRGSPGRTPSQGGPLPRTAPTRATAPPRPGQRSWQALSPRLRGAPLPPGQRAGAPRARRAPRQRGGGLAASWWSLLSVAVQHAVTTTALSGEWLLPATATSENAPIWPKSSTWRRQSRQAFCHSGGDNYGGHPPATARPVRTNIKKELGNK